MSRVPSSSLNSWRWLPSHRAKAPSDGLRQLPEGVVSGGRKDPAGAGPQGLAPSLHQLDANREPGACHRLDVLRSYATLGIVADKYALSRIDQGNETGKGMIPTQIATGTESGLDDSRHEPHAILMKRATISQGGQVQVPAEVRRRWETRELLIEDRGTSLVLRPLPDDPIGAALGSLAGPGPSSTEIRRRGREEDAERDAQRGLP